MLTLTAILVGMLLLNYLRSIFKKKIEDGGDAVAILLDLASVGVVVWQFYFRMLPLAWGGE